VGWPFTQGRVGDTVAGLGRVHSPPASAFPAGAFRQDPALRTAGQPRTANAAAPRADIAGDRGARGAPTGIALAAPVPALREGGVVPGAGGAAAAVQSRADDNRHLMSRSPHPPPPTRARKPNRGSVGRPILFANGKERAQLVFHAQDDAMGSARRTRGPEIRPHGAGVWAHRQPARAASSHARGDSGRYFPL